jgi:DNA repair protein RecO (recombination protein O)
MQPVKLKTLAVPIRIVDYSDSSQIVSFLTRERGIVDAIAKGAYREKNSYQGPFDLATLCEVVLIDRSRGLTLAIVAEATQLDGFRGVRWRWRRHLAASHVLEFIRAVGTAQDPSPDLFDLSARALDAIARAEGETELTELLCAYELGAFRLLGLAGEISRCGDCGRPWLEEARPVFFSPEVAGVLCPRCRKARPARRGRLVPGAVVRHINRLGRAGAALALEPPAAATPAGAGRLDAGARLELRRLLAELRLYLIERPFQTLQYTADFL